MNNKRYFFNFLFLLICFNSFCNQNKMILKLEDCVELAKNNNISISIQQNTLNDLKRKNNSSWNSVSPSLNVDGSFSDDFEKNSQNFSVSGTLGIKLSTNLYTSIQSAKLNYENGILGYEQFVKQIELEVWKEFYNLIYMEEYYKFQQKNVETAKKTYEENLKKFQNGKISELDVMTSQVNYENKKPTLESSYIELLNSYQVFKQLLGIPQETELKLQGSFDKFLNLEKIVLPENDFVPPDIKSAEKNVEIAKNNLLSQKFFAYGPSISGTYKYGKNSNLSNSEMNTTNSFSVGVSIPLDGYLPWSNSSVSVNTQKENLKSAELTLQDLKTSVKVKSENYLRTVNQIITSLNVLKKNVDLAKKTYEMTETAYNYGKTDFISLQNANDNVLNAQISLYNQAKTLINTILDMEYLLGFDLGTIVQVSTCD